MATIRHWNEVRDKWEQYKNTHTKEEIIADMENFFSLDRDSEISKIMTYVYYGINCF